MTKYAFYLLAMAGLLLAPEVRAQNAVFELKDGDRVAFLGDTLMEREQTYGRIETAMTLRYPDRNITFRNLGWSGDTPQGTSRQSLSLLQAGKEPDDEGFKLLKGQIELVKPTVVFLGYGMANSFEGEEGLSTFVKDLQTLIDTIQQIVGKDKVRFVVVSPIKHEKLPEPLPDPAKHNEQLAAYTKALKELAQQRGFPFVSLFDQMAGGTAKQPLTDNGIHLTDFGYQRASAAIERSLGWQPTKLSKAQQEQAEALRELILGKNELFFHRSRPANMAYIFGFRKREQGNNAVEIPQFDALIQTEEAKIAKLRKLDGTASVATKPKSKSDANPFPETKLETMNFDVAEGFEVNLYAENPLLAKPIQMNFDAQGRLWIASSEVYPQIAPGQEAKDKVIILEDVDRDGVAEKSTVFADGLLIPTGIAPGDGGVYVGQSTELLHFSDTNGDGKADKKQIVLSGFGTEDTHHIIHTLRWAHDGQLYFNQSIYIRTYTETPHGVVRLESGGILNYRPPTKELDVLFRGWVNTWGHHFDRYGQSFVTDGAGFMGLHWGLPGAMYFTYANARRTLESISPGNFPKFCGLETVYSQQFPEDWQGDFITCDFRAHRIVRFKVTEQGSGYAAKEMPDVLRTADVSFRPIDVKFGPDGALYIADWSNPIIQHGEVDFRDPRRDHEHGRIWRIKAKNRPLVAKPNIVKASNRDLLENLLSPTGFTREQSSRVLTEKGKSIEGDLKKWLGNQKTEIARLEALWMYQAIDVVEPKLLKELLMAKDGRVRAAATRVLSYWMKRIPESEALLAERIGDEHPRVRVEAMRALSKIPTSRSAELVLGVLDKPMDPFLDYAVWLSINDLAQPWIEAVRSGAWKIDGREKQLEFAMKSIEPQLASTVLGQLLKMKPLQRNGAGPWIEMIGQAGGAGELKLLLDTAVNGGFDAPAAERAINALTEALRLRKVRPSGDLAGIGGLIDKGPAGVRAAAIRLAGNWKLGQFTQRILQIAGDAKESAPVRDAAFAGLQELGGKPVIEGLRKLASAEQAASLRRQAAVALASLDRKQSMPQIVDVIRSTANDKEALDLWRSLLSFKDMAGAIASGLPASGFPEVPTQAGLRVAREGGRTETELVLALSKAGGLTLSDKELSTAELQAMATKAVSKGDPSRGESIYRRADLGCVLCHAIGGAGGKVGPDMTSIGASAPADYLVESMLYPNRKIKEGYHSIIVETKDDQEFSGVLVRETEQEIFLRNAANQEVSVAKNNVRTRKNGLSLMPSGLVDVLSEQERQDLIRFLSELGKPGPFDAAKGNVARTWRLLAGTHRIEQFGVDKIVTGQIDEQWKPFMSFVSGGMPADEILNAISVTRNVGLVSIYAATDFQVTKAGEVKFKVPDGASVMAWIGGKQLKSGSLLSANLPAGKHTMILRLDAKNVPQVLRLESSDVSFVAN